jgi:ribosome-associated protein
MPQAEDQLPDDESKTQRKKDMLALQDLGKTLIGLSATQLAQIPLPPELLELIRVAHTLKTHESKRRHLQYIGKRMRHVDAEEIKKALMNVQMGNARQTDQFHHVEEWRERLIEEGDKGLQELMAAYPEIDRQQVRQLIRKAQHDRKTEKKTGGELELFRFLREIIKS